MRHRFVLLVLALCLGCDQHEPASPISEAEEAQPSDPVPELPEESPQNIPPAKFPETLVEKASYVQGYLVGQQMAQYDPPFDIEQYLGGV